MGYGLGYGFGFDGVGRMLGIMPLLTTAVFAIVIVCFIVAAVKSLGQWNRNNRSPRLSVPSEVVTKRTHVTRHRHAGAGDATGAHGFYPSSATRYYVTFQVDSGDRMEFSVDGAEYGMLAEGDRGDLTFQGTRYLSFERN